MIDCGWKKTTGLDCPACGMQRSTLSLLKGELLESIQLFPALIPLILLLIYTILHLFKPSMFPAKWIIRMVILTGVLMVLNWVLKMF